MGQYWEELELDEILEIRRIPIAFNRTFSKIPIVQDLNSGFYKNLNESFKSQTGSGVSVSSVIADTGKTIGLTSVAVVIRYFQIVDLITNFFSKLNVETPQLIDKITKYLNKLDFPKIGFLEGISLTDDGGKEMVEKYKEKYS